MHDGENCCKKSEFPIPQGYELVSGAVLKMWSDRLLENWNLYKRELQAKHPSAPYSCPHRLRDALPGAVRARIGTAAAGSRPTPMKLLPAGKSQSLCVPSQKFLENKEDIHASCSIDPGAVPFQPDAWKAFG